MKLVIDIDEYTYREAITHGGNSGNLVIAVRKGKPLDDILNKIRAEIEELDGRYVIGDYAYYGESSPKYVRLWEVLQIIDEYKAESDGEE